MPTCRGKSPKALVLWRRRWRTQGCFDWVGTCTVRKLFFGYVKAKQLSISTRRIYFCTPPNSKYEHLFGFSKSHFANNCEQRHPEIWSSRYVVLCILHVLFYYEGKGMFRFWPLSMRLDLFSKATQRTWAFRRSCSPRTKPTASTSRRPHRRRPRMGKPLQAATIAVHLTQGRGRGEGRREG